MKHGENEPIDQFVTRMKQKAKRCNFADVHHEIKDQIVFNFHSDRLRRKTLRDDLNLQNLVVDVRAIELSNNQAVLIEEKDQEDLYRSQKPSKYSNKQDKDKSNKKETDNKGKCFACGNTWPHKNGKILCPAFGHHCKRCSKQNYFKIKCKFII